MQVEKGPIPSFGIELEVATLQRVMGSIVEISEVVRNLVTALGALIAGIWAYRRFNLDEKPRHDSRSNSRRRCFLRKGTRYVVFLDVVLSNRGTCVIKAHDYDVAQGRLAYTDDDDRYERHLFSCTLQIRQLPSSSRDLGVVDWFTADLDAPPGIPPSFPDEELNLIDAYDRNGRPDFWMEPGEVYHLGTVVVLDAGLYLERVSPS